MVYWRGVGVCVLCKEYFEESKSLDDCKEFCGRG